MNRAEFLAKLADAALKRGTDASIAAQRAFERGDAEAVRRHRRNMLRNDRRAEQLWGQHLAALPTNEA